MNRQVMVMFSIVAACFVVLIASGVLSAILLFILMGSIPGTRYALSPDVMLGILVTVFSFFAIKASIKVIAVIRKRKLVQLLTKRRAQLPNRRYAKRAAHS